MTLTFDGRAVSHGDGQTIADALIAAGVHSWGDYHVFCGIGACHGCLVTVDGVAGRRACLVPATDGAVVTSEHAGTHTGDRAADLGDTKALRGSADD